MRSYRVSLVGVVLVLAAAAAPVAAQAGSPTRPGFGPTTALPPKPGLGLKHNADAEPGIGVSPDGQIWIASDVDPGTNDPRVQGGALSGTDIWTSRDGGRTFRYVADPFGSTSIAYSIDGGESFTLLPGAGIPVQDRQWLAADGPCRLYVGYHQIGTQLPLVTTLDVCDPSTTYSSSALSPTDAARFLAGSVPFESNLIGKLVVDTHPRSPYAHRIYFPMEQCLLADLTRDPVGFESGATPSCPGKAELIVGISDDGGRTFTDVHVATSPQNVLSIWPATVAVDDAGTAYFAWHDSRHSYLNVSRDGGMTWSASRRVDGLRSAAVYPTVAAGRAGQIDVTYVGAPEPGDSNARTTFGRSGAEDSTPWRIVDARSRDGGRTFTTTPMSAVVHRGALCTYGGGCPGDGSRNFLDDFGAVINPRTGLLTAVFTSDQPSGKRADNVTVFVTERAATG